MATADDYASWIVKNADKKGTPEFATVAAAYQQAKGDTASAPHFDPSEGGGTLQFGPLDTGIKTPQWLDRALAGAGKSFADTGRGLWQAGTLNGADAQAAVNEAKVRDAPLMNTGMGMAGHVVGDLAQMVGPSAALGAAGKAASLPMLADAASAYMLPKTILGAAGQGAALGAIQPVATGESRLLNTAFGAAGGAAIPGAIAGGKIVKSLADPFMTGGRERIAARVMERFAADPSTITSNAARELVPGSLPTLAESTQDIGLAQLQRSLRNNPDANNAITQRMLSNQDARMSALQGIAGDPGQRDFYSAARGTAAQGLYDKAFNEVPTNTPWVKGQITQLMKRPTFQQAWGDATTLALDDGIKLDVNNLTQVSHYAKMALDRRIEDLTGKPTQQAAVQGIKDKLVSLMESKDFAPSYREARDTYAQMSKPINQMDVGKELVNSLQPALADFGATVRATPQKYAQALRDSDATARRATGWKGAKMENILSPEQMATAQNVGHDVGRSANAQFLGMSQGSPTAQNLVSQDILRQAMTPFGLPKSWAESAIVENLLRPVQFAYKPSENRVMGLLGHAMLDPAEAKRLLLKELAKRGHRGGDNFIPYSSAPGSALGVNGLLGLTQ